MADENFTPGGARDCGAPVLATENITKSFGNISALRGVSFSARAGEVAAIVGDNGSGKSTFIKILSGNLAPDGGVITVGGRRYARLTPKQSQAAGISTVYQDLSLDDYRDVAANIFLGHELTYGGIFAAGRLFLRRAEAGGRRRARRLPRAQDSDFRRTDGGDGRARVGGGAAAHWRPRRARHGGRYYLPQHAPGLRRGGYGERHAARQAAAHGADGGDFSGGCAGYDNGS